MPEAMSEVYAVIGIGFTMAISAGAAIFAGWKTAHWLLDQVGKLIASQQEELRNEVQTVNGKLDEALLAVRSLEVTQNKHGERLAWLEGQAGQPLGSITRDA